MYYLLPAGFEREDSPGVSITHIGRVVARAVWWQYWGGFYCSGHGATWRRAWWLRGHEQGIQSLTCRPQGPCLPTNVLDGNTGCRRRQNIRGTVRMTAAILILPSCGTIGMMAAIPCGFTYSSPIRNFLGLLQGLNSQLEEFALPDGQAEFTYVPWLQRNQCLGGYKFFPC